MSPTLFTSLPTELVEQILTQLDQVDAARLALVSRWCRKLTISKLWAEVDLVDRPDTTEEIDEFLAAREGHFGDLTTHNDTRIIEKLITIANNDDIAQEVRILTHRCYHRPPLLYDDLPKSLFVGQTVSYDPRLIKLVYLVSRKLKNLHTLRITNGHPRLVEAFLRCLFDVDRHCDTPIRRLWLENCNLAEGLDGQLPKHKLGLPIKLSFSGLQSIRLRRLPMQVYKVKQSALSVVQAPTIHRDHDDSLTNDVASEWSYGQSDGAGAFVLLTKYFSWASIADDQSFEKASTRFSIPGPVSEAHIASHKARAVWAYQTDWSEDWAINKDHPDYQSMYRMNRPAPAINVMHMLQHCASTLTSLNFDWVLMRSLIAYSELARSDCDRLQLEWYQDLFRLRFPALRALQFRNCVTWETEMPQAINMLDRTHWPSCFVQCHDPHSEPHSCNDGLLVLDFMEAHPKIQALAWPMHHFFAHVPSDIPSERALSVVDNLARNLIDLRIDVFGQNWGEPHTEEHDYSFTRERRRRFISELAPRLRAVQGIKMSGGIPFDEKRETLRALGQCQLQRISLIGICSSIGNTWGRHAERFWDVLRFHEKEHLAREDEAAIVSLAYDAPLDKLPPFEPVYQWAGSPSMVSVITHYHRHTLRELKLCGEKGGIAILDPTAITHPMLAGLKHMHKLESLIASLWIPVWFEDDFRDDEVMEYWQAPTSSTTTALVSTDIQPQENAWQAFLDKLKPEKLAQKMVDLFGQHLSKTAMSQRGGMFVRGSFGLGRASIFDLDIWIGLDAAGQPCLLDYLGPREEFASERRQSKLDRRRWF